MIMGVCGSGTQIRSGQTEWGWNSKILSAQGNCLTKRISPVLEECCSNLDHLQLMNLVHLQRPSEFEAVPDVSGQPSIRPDPEDLPKAPELSVIARRPECGSMPVVKTRSGRVVKKPTRYTASGE